MSHSGIVDVDVVPVTAGTTEHYSPTFVYHHPPDEHLHLQLHSSAVVHPHLHPTTPSFLSTFQHLSPASSQHADGTNSQPSPEVSPFQIPSTRIPNVVSGCIENSAHHPTHNTHNTHNVSNTSSSANSSSSSPNVRLLDTEMWRRFCAANNEMIVTKSGRRMFPLIRCQVSGLESRAMYSIALEFEQLGNNRWKYLNGSWVTGGKSEPAPAHLATFYLHPDSPNFGSHWMKEIVSFTKVKLTNKPTAAAGQVVLNSLHRYQPRIHIVRIDHHTHSAVSTLRTDESADVLPLVTGSNGNAADPWLASAIAAAAASAGCDSLPSERSVVASYAFPETQFIAVTAYQNEEVTHLKIKFNPFAKAFQDIRGNDKPILSSGSSHFTPSSAVLPSVSHSGPPSVTLSERELVTNEDASNCRFEDTVNNQLSLSLVNPTSFEESLTYHHHAPHYHSAHHHHSASQYQATPPYYSGQTANSLYSTGHLYENPTNLSTVDYSYDPYSHPLGTYTAPTEYSQYFGNGYSMPNSVSRPVIPDNNDWGARMRSASPLHPLHCSISDSLVTLETVSKRSSDESSLKSPTRKRQKRSPMIENESNSN